MKVLVTGGAGYVGSHAALALRDDGHEVVILDDLSTGHGDAVPPGCRFIEGDVGDLALLLDTLGAGGFDGILHFSGSSIVEESVAAPLRYYRNNTANSLTLLEACVRAGVRSFIFSSTAAVYGQPASNPVAEDDETQPINPYGWSKLMTEHAIADAQRAAESFHFGILRYFNVAGADPGLRSGPRQPAASHLIKVAAEAAVGARPQITVFGTDYPTRDGTCIRDFIHVSDLASVHVALLAEIARRPRNLTLNCGYGRGYSVREVLAAVARLADAEPTVRDGPRRPGDAPEVVADVGRLRRTLDWRPRFDDLDRIVETALAWERHHRNLPDG